MVLQNVDVDINTLISISMYFIFFGTFYNKVNNMVATLNEVKKKQDEQNTKINFDFIKKITTVQVKITNIENRLDVLEKNGKTK